MTMNVSMQPVRILHIVTYMGRGGIETMLMNYYRHIDRNKIQFDFLVHRDFRADYDDEIELLGGHIYRVPPMNPMSLTYKMALRNFFRTHPYSIVHCHLNYMSGVVLAEAMHAGVPIRIAHAHTANLAPGWKQWVRRLFKHLIPMTATTLLACSSEAGRAVFGTHSFGIMPNAVDASFFSFNQSLRTDLRQNLGLSHVFTIMHVGRFIYAKNHEFLLDVFSHLLSLIPSARLVLIGDGELFDAVEERAQKTLPPGSVVLLGTRTDIPDLLQAADIFVFPSIFEGLPVTLIEAQAAGLPCIKSDTVSDECVVTDLVTSLPIDDPSLWAQEILKKRGVPRRSQYDAIVQSGYEITSAAKKLENFYLNGDPICINPF